MRFTKIEIENYRSYRGKQTIEFDSKNTSRNINIILGRNGTGKTSLLNAVHWCLYDEESEIKTGSLLNNFVAKGLEKGGHADVSVTAYLQDDEYGISYMLKRSHEYEKNGETIDSVVPSQKESSFFFYSSERGGEGHESNQFQDAEMILPKGVKRFFIFNGEDLKSFFGLTGPTDVHDAVLDVSQIDLLRTTVSHLEVTRAEEAKGLTKNRHTEDLASDLQRARRLIEDKRQAIKNRSQQIGSSKERLEYIKESLRKSNAEAVRKRQEAFDDLRKTVEELETKISEDERRRGEMIRGHLPFLYSRDAMVFANTLITRLEEEGRIPPEISQRYLNGLLEKKLCICGTQLGDNSKERDKVVHLLNELSKGSDFTQVYTDLRPRISDALEIEGFISSLRNLGINISKDRAELKRKEEELRSMPRSSVQTNELDEINRLEDEERSLSDAYESELVYLGADRKELEDLEKEESAINSKIKEILKREDKDKATTFRVELYDGALEVLGSIGNKILDDVQSRIEKRTNDYFHEMIWKKEAYGSVKISGEYKISMRDVTGAERVGNLSAGEEQVLAFSFMAALKEISGFDAPIIIDSPLGRIDPEQKDEIAESLPNFLKDKQVTLLMTNSEYTPRMAKALEDRVAGIYEIAYDDETDSSSIVKKAVTT